MPFPSALRRTDYLTAAAILLVVSLVCTQVPLLNYLGYESSFAVAIIISVLSGILTIRRVREAYHGRTGEHATQLQTTMRAFWSSLQWGAVLLLIPLLILTVNVIIVKNCSYVMGLAFFLSLPVVSVCFSSALGFFCALHYRRAKSTFFLLFAASVAYDLALGYFTPAIFSYNFFYGFFPGLTYDEALSPTMTLLLFRLLTLGLAALFAWLGHLLLTRGSPSFTVLPKGTLLLRLLVDPSRRIITGAIAVVLCLLYLFRCHLGFESTASYIQSQLGERYETEHFVIVYARGSYNQEEIQRVAADHEFRLAQIMRAFSLHSQPRISSYVYPTDGAKFRFIGTATTNIAKPWLNELHTTKQSLEGTLKHELVHVVAARFGLPVIRANFSTGLVEGLAMAVEWDWGNRTLHQYAAAMRRFNVEPDIKRLMTFAGFASSSSSVSYVLAGSFCRYLIDRYGIRSMAALYGSGNYLRVYGRELDALIGEWHDFLDQIPVPESDRIVVDVLFRRPAIFGKVCARVIGQRNAAAASAFAARDYALAEKLYSQSYEEGRGYEALSGLLASALRTGNYNILTSVLDTVIRPEPRSDQYLPLFMNIGDALWAVGKPDEARKLYAQVRLADFSEAYTEAAAVRIQACPASGGSAGLLRYFLSGAPDSVRITVLDSLLIANPADTITRYLRGKALLRMSRNTESMAVLDSLNMLTLDRVLEAVRLKSEGLALYRLGMFQKAKEKVWLSLNAVRTDAAQIEVDDWIERCEWMGKRGARSQY
jgi:tetratricopeptide (TPR) repeat protein